MVSMCAVTLEERKQVTKTVLDQANGRAPIIVHVSCVAVRDAIKLAQHAQQVGADGVSSIIPPLYHDAQSIYTYFAAVGAAAPDLPLLTYVFGGPDRCSRINA